ncbi:MAG TPA: MEMAR_RS02690 family S-layer glycoprotein [Methanospirillum sp.]|uniref:MEMAR_RS02690 family S-layer glycoprotein n=1 Tax=Methanospirillum sp. TaxID=45200 RepID=UPI002B6457C8|nr:MEMAR_RS02690 family S-layer glycoprotein [Methanospirillum sp.]HWQ64118.1 MEMAR_RS02690 family S-layer glycoprotein [Methanospirillum sp.]
MTIRFLILIALFLIIPGLVAGTSVVIPPGGDVFLGEEGLDVRAAVPSPYDEIAFYPPGSSPGRDIPLDVRHLEKTSFSVSPNLYSDRTGSWYQWDSRMAVPGSIAFNVREPRVSVRILQRLTMEDISSGTVPRGSDLLFQMDTNLGSIAQRPGYNPASDGIFDLLISTPGGGTLTAVETKTGSSISLTRITPQDSLQVFPAIQTGGWDTGAVGSGNYLYAAGMYTIQPKLAFNRADENLKSTSAGYNIRSASITLGSDRTTIGTRDDQVIRGHSFSVTISGTPGVPVYFWVDAGSRTGSPGDQPPMILFAQEGVSQDSPDGPYSIGSYQPTSAGGRSIRELVPREPYNGVKYYGMIVPDRNGKRTLELRTTDQTDDARYTLKVESQSGGSTVHTDEIPITVQKGSVSVATGKDVYAIGEEVRLSGHNSESCDTYLFITGPNLPSAGGRLDRPRQAVTTGNPSSFTTASGDCETWDYRLYTGELGLDAGTYTIYAVPAPVSRNNLGSVPYQTISLTLKRPYVSLMPQETEVAKGDSLTLTGMSSGVGSGTVAVWIFGRNYFRYDQASVERDGHFEYEIPAWQTSDMVAGQYVVIIQHPMTNGEFDIWPDGQRQLVLGRYPYSGAPIFRVGGPGALMGSDGANALISALNSAYIDDTYTRWDIRVMSPKINLNSTSLRQDADGPVKIWGTTNLGAGKRLLIEVSDNKFAPTRKDTRDDSYGFSGTAEIQEGVGERYFSLTVPKGKLAPGEYRVLVQGVESEATTSGLLTITQPTPAVTLQPTIRPDTPTQIENGSSNRLNESVNETPTVRSSTQLIPTISQVPQVTPVTPVQTPLSVATQVPEQSDDRMFSLVTGMGAGLLIAGLVALLVYVLRRKGDDESEDVTEEEDNGSEETEGEDNKEEKNEDT